MRAGIINLGDEVLSGQIINTNGAYLASKLTQLGFQVDVQLVVSDFDTENKERIKSMSQEVDLIMCSGGLGPTVDDLTRHLLAELSESQLIFDQAVYDDLKQRFGDQLYHRIQAMVPEKAIKFKNSTGQAPGFLIALKNCFLIALPGVPHEMRTIFEEGVIPFLMKEFKSNKPLFEGVIHLFDLLEVEIDPYLKKLQITYPDVMFGIYPAYGTLRLQFKGPNLPEIEGISKFFIETFKRHVFQSKTGKLEQAVFDFLKAKHFTLAMAESITGGHLSSRMVNIPGISSVFLGSCVVYSDDLKTSILNVHPAVIQKYGAVSPETALCMLEGVLEKTKAHVACALTGIAGPLGASETKKVGLVYIAIGIQGKKPEIIPCQFSGDRAIIIEKACTYTLGYLMQYLINHA